MFKFNIYKDKVVITSAKRGSRLFTQEIPEPINKILFIRKLSLKKFSFSFFLGDCWLIMYTSKVQGAPTNPIVFLFFTKSFVLTFFNALYTG